MCRVRVQIRFWCARASTLIASTSGVTGDWPVVVPVGADQIRQYFGVPGIRFRPGYLMAVTVAGDRQRVDREHLIPGRTERLDPQAAIGFDTDHHMTGSSAWPAINWWSARMPATLG